MMTAQEYNQKVRELKAQYSSRKEEVTQACQPRIARGEQYAQQDFQDRVCDLQAWLEDKLEKLDAAYHSRK